MRPRAVVAGTLGLFVAGLSGCAGGERPKRVVLITLDTLRADVFHGEPTGMPRTRAWASEALVFEHHYTATSTTQPTHATLLTGLDPWVHGVVRNGIVLPDELETLPERVAAAGWFTGAIVASFPLESRFGFDQGFEVYDDAFEIPLTERWEGEEIGAVPFFSHARSITDRALALLDRAGDGDQLLWFHYFDPHAPWGSSKGENGEGLLPRRIEHELDESHERAERARAESEEAYEREVTTNRQRAQDLVRASQAAYAADVRYLDEHLARLLARLDADAERFETHVVVTGDHGESLGDDGWLGHGKHLTPQQIRVPAIVRSPRVEPASRTEPTGSVDVTATLASCCDVPPLSPRGRDLSAERLRGEPIVGMRRTFVEPYRQIAVDGSEHVIEGHRFYYALREGVFRGDAAAVTYEELTPQTAERARNGEVQKLFGTFVDLLDGAPLEELLDGETQAMLEGLGYVR